MTGYTLITLRRLDATDHGVFGHLEWDDFDCVTLERGDTLIKEGIYKVVLDKSPHLGYVTPHLIVPERDKAAGGDAGIRIHIANWVQSPNDGHYLLKSCIAVGENREGFAVEHSKDAFDQMMAKWPKGEVEIKVL
jgi:hypothetical protein